MVRLRVLLAAAASLAALAAVPGASGTGWPLDATATLDSAHFRVHYVADYTASGFVSQAQAGDVLGWAERAYSLYRSWGYPAPVDDGDGLIDLTVLDFSSLGQPWVHYDGAAIPDDRTTGTTDGQIWLDYKRGTNFHTVAHELFNVFQWAVFSQADLWLEQGSAEWAAYRAESFVTPTADSLGEPDRSLDCAGSECGYDRPSSPTYDAFYDRSASPGWSFFEYLSERYGPGVVQDVWNRAAADGAGVPSTTPLDEVLTARGSSLSAAFSAWIGARLDGDFDLLALVGTRPQLFASTATGSLSGPIPTQIVAVNHLAARYLAFLPGDSTAAGPCYAASLALSVSLPAGVVSQPYFFVDTVGSNPQPLLVAGGTASITVPWNTCAGGAAGYLSLPNATTDPAVNGNELVVTGTLTVDPSTLASPTPPPLPVEVHGAVVNAPTSAVPPDIDVFGPELIRVAAGQTTLRLIVSADSDGVLQASLGPYALGTAPLRAGGNDVRFALPAGARARLRTTAAASGVLRLTSVASSGTLGETVTRLVSIERPAKRGPGRKRVAKRHPARLPR